jgi:hypothetical protein
LIGVWGLLRGGRVGEEWMYGVQCLAPPLQTPTGALRGLSRPRLSETLLADAAGMTNDQHASAYRYCS